MEKKERKRVDKYKSKRKRNRRGFNGTPAWQKNVERGDVDDYAFSNIPIGGEEIVNNPVINGQPLLAETVAVDESIMNMSAYKLAGNDVINKMNIEEKEDGPSASVVKGYKMIDSGILQDVLNFCSKCDICGKDKSLSLLQNNNSKRGLCEKLYLQCRECKQIVQTFFTSNTSVNNNKHIDINLRSVYGTISAGGGLSMLRTFCRSMDLPSPVHPAPYSRYIKHILKSVIEN